MHYNLFVSSVSFTPVWTGLRYSYSLDYVWHDEAMVDPWYFDSFTAAMVENLLTQYEVRACACAYG